jgi:hypothetical protein
MELPMAAHKGLAVKVLPIAELELMPIAQVKTGYIPEPPAAVNSTAK